MSKTKEGELNFVTEEKLNQEIFNDSYADCKLGYYKTEGELYLLRNLSEAEVREIIKANLRIYDFHFYNRRINEMNNNLDDYFKTFYLYEEKIKNNSAKDITTEFKEEVFIETNRRLISFLASMKNLIEDLRNKWFRKGTTEWEEFNKFAGNIFDSYFAYRFFNKLRDYSLHSNFPIQVVSMSFDKNSDSGKLEVLFDKSILLTNESFSSSYITQPLEDFADRFPVNDLLFQLQEPLGKVIDNFYSMEKTEISNCIAIIEKYQSEVPKNNIGLVFKDTGKSSNKGFYLPTQATKILKTKFNT